MPKHSARATIALALAAVMACGAGGADCARARSGGKAKLWVYTGSNCGECDQWWHDLKTDAEFGRAIESRYVIIGLPIEDRMHAASARRYGFTHVPGFLTRDRSRTGYKGKADFLDWLGISPLKDRPVTRTQPRPEPQPRAPDPPGDNTDTAAVLQAVEGLQGRMDQAHAAMQERIEQNAAGVARANDRFVSLSKRLGGIESELAGFQDWLGKANERAERINGTLDRLTARMDGIERGACPIPDGGLGGGTAPETGAGEASADDASGGAADANRDTDPAAVPVADGEPDSGGLFGSILDAARKAGPWISTAAAVAGVAGTGGTGYAVWKLAAGLIGFIRRRRRNTSGDREDPQRPFRPEPLGDGGNQGRHFEDRVHELTKELEVCQSSLKECREARKRLQFSRQVEVPDYSDRDRLVRAMDIVAEQYPSARSYFKQVKDHYRLLESGERR